MAVGGGGVRGLPVSQTDLVPVLSQGQTMWNVEAVGSL